MTNEYEIDEKGSYIVPIRRSKYAGVIDECIKSITKEGEK